MLSALAFLTIIIGLFAANNNTKAPILERYPIPFTYTSEGVNAFEQKHITTIETELTKIFNMTNISLLVLKDTASKESIAIMKMSDYNAIAQQLNRPKITLDSSSL